MSLPKSAMVNLCLNAVGRRGGMYKRLPNLPKPSLDIHSTTWPQNERLLRPSHGLCVAGIITMQNRNKVQSKIELPAEEFFKYLLWFRFY